MPKKENKQQHRRRWPSKKTNPHRRRPDAVVWDADARRDYLQGFSKRKQDRRAYGLAMQKVKDRNQKLQERAEVKQAEQEQIQEAEERKQQWMSLLLNDEEKPDNDDSHDDNNDDRASSTPILPAAEAASHFAQPEPTNNEEDEEVETETTVVQTYQDAQTQQQWGGQVIVTTSTHIPGESDDNDEDNDNGQIRKKQASRNNKRTKQQRPHDTEQEYAGNVEKYLTEIKAHMPAKKKKNSHHGKRRGKHGAANMKGVGTASDLKVAQKVLARSGGGKLHGTVSAHTSKKRKR